MRLLLQLFFYAKKLHGQCSLCKFFHDKIHYLMVLFYASYASQSTFWSSDLCTTNSSIWNSTACISVFDGSSNIWCSSCVCLLGTSVTLVPFPDSCLFLQSSASRTQSWSASFLWFQPTPQSCSRAEQLARTKQFWFCFVCGVVPLSSKCKQMDSWRVSQCSWILSISVRCLWVFEIALWT